MFANMSRKKGLLVLLGVFVLLFILNYIFVVRHVRLAKTHPNLPESFPADTAGPWQSYVWKGKLFGYPNDWVLVENRGTSTDKNAEVISFTLSPKTMKNPDDMIGVGGGMCDTLRQKLCVGNEPVYTNSRDSDVLIIYNTIIKHISKVQE